MIDENLDENVNKKTELWQKRTNENRTGNYNTLCYEEILIC